VPKKKPINPFYVVLVLAGVAFGLTALGYFVMAAMATYDPVGSREAMDREGGLLAVMDRFGVQMMIVELIVLAAATVLAIGTDRFWARLSESRQATTAGPTGDDSKKEE
jgi:hypothetical protein